MSNKKKVIEMPSDQYKNCPRCKHRLLICDNFSQMKNGRVSTTCLSCLKKRREYSKKNPRKMCPHNRRKNVCKECGGVDICEHNRQRYSCVECGGASICQHNRRRQSCKECCGGNICQHDKIRGQCKVCTDPVKLTLQQMIRDSRKTDKKYNRYDADNHIDYCFLQGLVEDYPTCYWDDCKVQLQYKDYQDDLATIERLDNSIGHTKSNCVLACLKCNKLKKSNR